ncbi:YfcC family protein [Larsenimonas rhizosphaerae]|uniref:AbgT family transporter n=1 Tax=Larsenimonas rhizosphaerae TaxID=2944682 RepID=A0AA41ZHP8_9GAMM|nr:TIGR00366 family protein [Larsenimonas rhizosphaerae]MCM2131204.1 AbgT family transporter [Larsenimonas rhizosphaerae]MCX2525437.1 AbgT family transporter [Larsenimonas rhizosphaerae]
MTKATVPWYQRVPHPAILILGLLVVVWGLTWVIPAGSFDYHQVNGRQAVIPGTFHLIEQPPPSFLAIFQSIPLGMVESASIIVAVFVGGGLFRVLEATGALENMVGTLVRRVGRTHPTLLIWVMTLVFGALGVAVGYENNIALVPIAILLGLALGGDRMVGAGIAIGGVGIGFATSPINVYTVGVSDQLAQLPMFSGAGLRSVLCIGTLMLMAHHTSRYMRRITRNTEASLLADVPVDEGSDALDRPLADYHLSGRDLRVLGSFIVGMAVMLYGVFVYGWYINEIAGAFIAMAIAAGIMARMPAEQINRHFFEGAASVTTGALLVGLARALQVLLEKGHIGDTLVHALSEPLASLPVLVSTLAMTLVHGLINFFIPSGSGQAMATMPIMIPLSDLIGMTRQTAILAFQLGDGLTNMVVPTSGGTLAMLAIARVPYDRWVRFFFPMLIKAFLLGWVMLTIAVLTGWGPA